MELEKRVKAGNETSKGAYIYIQKRLPRIGIYIRAISILAPWGMNLAEELRRE